jgi:hypothetical protein
VARFYLPLFLFAAQIFNYRDAQWGLDLLRADAPEPESGDLRVAPQVLVDQPFILNPAI